MFKSLPFQLKKFGLNTPFSVFCCFLLLSGCHDKNQKKEMPPPLVSVLRIEPQTIFPVEEYTGRTAGVLEVDVRAQVSGILLKRVYREGGFVQKGDVLFIIDPAPFEEALIQAESTLADASARAENAKKEWLRINGLFKKKAVSAKERDTAVAQFEQTKAQAEEAAAAVKIAKINLGYTTVRAPITGITNQEKRTIGNLIGTSQTDNLLTQITQFDPIYVHFSYPDSNILRLQRLVEKGNATAPQSLSFKASLKLADGRDYPHVGHVDFTNSAIDQKTGSVEARIVVPNPEGKLLPGQFVRVAISGFEFKNAILIPEKAVMQGPQGTFVYALDTKCRAHMQPIKLGIKIKENVFVENGLKAGDVIITDGMIRVRPEGVVKVSSDLKVSAVPPPENKQ